MYAVATCTATVLRGTSTNAWGDTVDNATVSASGIPARIYVHSSVVQDSATQTPRVVRRILGIISSATNILDTDQLRDDTNGVTYAIESVTQPNGPGRTPDLELALRQVK